MVSLWPELLSSHFPDDFASRHFEMISLSLGKEEAETKEQGEVPKGSLSYQLVAVSGSHVGSGFFLVTAERGWACPGSSVEMLRTELCLEFWLSREGHFIPWWAETSWCGGQRLALEAR